MTVLVQNLESTSLSDEVCLETKSTGHSPTPVKSSSRSNILEMKERKATVQQVSSILIKSGTYSKVFPKFGLQYDIVWRVWQYFRGARQLLRFVFATLRYQLRSFPYSFGVTSSKRFRKATWTSSVKSLACKLLPFFAKANLEHS